MDAHRKTTNCAFAAAFKMTLRVAHGMTLMFLQGFLLCGFLAIFDYGDEANAYHRSNNVYDGLKNESRDWPQVYIMYQDVHVMIWIGFGFLMTFLRRYGQSGIGLTFLVAAILVQVAMICQGVLHMTKVSGRAPLSLRSLLSADVAVAAPLISMGALLGKTTYMQLICMGIFELIVQTINKHIAEHHLQSVDAGESMYVHVFGAYFGLAVSWVLGLKDKPKEHRLEGANYQSDIFAMIGTVFLWLFWPSFNSATLEGDDQQRAIINTVLSISASCVTAFATSALVSRDTKFNMIHVQNSTLAGGVAIGTAAAMMCEPVGALAIGSLAGALSVVGYRFMTPLLQKYLGIHDTCGVHNLHGMPGVLAAVFGALMAGLASEANYDYSLYEIFPARAPIRLEELENIRFDFPVKQGLNRSAGQQAGYQLLALLVTWLLAIVSGIITGYIMKFPIFGSISDKQKFDDAALWELEEEEQESQSKQKEQKERVGNQLPLEPV